MAEKELYRGQEMVAGWHEQIELAQTIPTIILNGRQFNRIRYGAEQEDWGADSRSCRDCAVIKDQFHVSGCDVERCPFCGEQLISCDCVKEIV